MAHSILAIKQRGRGCLSSTEQRQQAGQMGGKVIKHGDKRKRRDRRREREGERKKEENIITALFLNRDVLLILHGLFEKFIESHCIVVCI